MRGERPFSAGSSTTQGIGAQTPVPASTATSVPSPNDFLTLLPARAASLTLTADFGRSRL